MQTFTEFYSHVSYYKLCNYMLHDELYENFKHCNGCGAKGGFQFPSTIWFVDIESACNLHDIEWKNANDYDDLVQANKNFNCNLKSITDTESMFFITAYFRRMRVAKYVAGVELVGLPSYAKERGFLK